MVRIRKKELIVIISALALLSFFKPVSTQSVFGDAIIKAGDSVGKTIASIITEFVKANALWFTLLVFALIIGLFLLPKN